MSVYLRDAKFDANKIDHFHKHAGINGFVQAEPYFEHLKEAIVRALRSKNDKGDAQHIRVILESVESQMKEMKEWANEGSDA